MVPEFFLAPDQQSEFERFLNLTLKHDQRLMHESIDYVDALAHFGTEKDCKLTILVSKSLGTWCHYR